MISRDTKVLDKKSPVYLRMCAYAELFDSLCVVVMGKKPGIVDIGENDNLHIIDGTSRVKFFSFFFCFVLSHYRIDKKSDWVTTQDPFESGLLGLYIAKKNNIKFQPQLHTDCFGYFYSRLSFFNFIRKYIALYVLRFATHIRVVSKRIKDSLIENNVPENKISVLPIFVDIKKFNSKDKEQTQDLSFDAQYKILISARLEKEKNIELALSAFSKFLRFFPDALLLIAGDGKERLWLQKYAEHLKIESRVKFLGWRNDIDVLCHLADMVLVTSFYEGYCLSLVEAVVAHTPVISTPVGIAEELPVRIVPYDPGRVAFAMKEIILNRQSYIQPVFVFDTEEDYLQKFKKIFY